ncbi:MAG TPA: hypothetical protein VLM40_03745, partial [Gemmata sp.]|nr:hypothetical protein [Gemmata sp.]
MSSLDPRIALQALVERLAATPRGRRTPVVIEILPFLADGRLTPAMRIAAAAGVLRAIPDRPRPVRRVVRALTVGLSRGLALARLRMLQRQLTRSRALDRLVAARERRLVVQCPRCKARLPRIELIKHLWHEHGLILKRRTLISGAQAAARDKEVFREVGEVEAIDRVAERLGAKGLRQWIAREGSFEELAPLISHAAENGAGLCPTCFNEIAIAVPPLPPPLVFVRGRLCGDGYFVAVGGNAWMTKLAIGSPERSSSVVRRWP